MTQGWPLEATTATCKNPLSCSTVKQEVGRLELNWQSRAVGTQDTVDCAFGFEAATYSVQGSDHSVMLDCAKLLQNVLQRKIDVGAECRQLSSSE
jgi:hypothetical protein